MYYFCMKQKHHMTEPTDGADEGIPTLQCKEYPIIGKTTHAIAYGYMMLKGEELPHDRETGFVQPTPASFSKKVARIREDGFRLATLEDALKAVTFELESLDVANAPLLISEVDKAGVGHWANVRYSSPVEKEFDRIAHDLQEIRAVRAHHPSILNYDLGHIDIPWLNTPLTVADGVAFYKDVFAVQHNSLHLTNITPQDTVYDGALPLTSSRFSNFGKAFYLKDFSEEAKKKEPEVYERRLKEIIDILLPDKTALPALNRALTSKIKERWYNPEKPPHVVYYQVGDAFYEPNHPSIPEGPRHEIMEFFNDTKTISPLKWVAEDFQAPFYIAPDKALDAHPKDQAYIVPLRTEGIWTARPSLVPLDITGRCRRMSVINGYHDQKYNSVIPALKEPHHLMFVKDPPVAPSLFR